MPPIWVHAASAGDVASIAPLVEALGRPATLTVVTATGLAMAARRLPLVPARRAPLLRPVRFAAHARPALLLLEGLELWPGLIAAARRHGARIAIVNGRISLSSLARYRALWRFFGEAVSAIDLVCARSAADAERFARLGVPAARIAVTGFTKYDGLPTVPATAAREAVVLGSTHRGEERRLAPALRALGRPVVVAPRYPRRPPPVRPRRGAGARGAGVCVIDTIGELRALYASAAIAFVGGSLVARGGHDVLEAAACGAPVVTGTHVDSVNDEMAALEAAGAAMRITSADGFADAARALLADAHAGARARAVAETFRGATERCVQLLRPLLDA
ncbi:MAG: glycosyltransferase N-terminal domain-containing protein [Myxococcota bacterium]